MLTAILWTLFGAVIGSVAGVFAVSLVASARHGRIANLERANARLLGELATECERSLELDRKIKALQIEADGWHVVSMNQ